MAQLNPAEGRMFAKYGGDRNLIDNEMFWLEVLASYQGAVVVMPIPNALEAYRKLAEMLECPPGQCGACCRCYDTVPLNDLDIKRLEKVKTPDELKSLISEIDGKKSLISKGGCPFLVNDSCSIYDKRPDSCVQFPCQTPVQTAAGPLITYRIKCQAGLNVIRQVMREAVSAGKLMLLADLSLANIEGLVFESKPPVEGWEKWKVPEEHEDTKQE